ncbi:unnamed protein product [Rotaria sordida]|uniref:Transposase Tc1-like domain-containing protein n=2 Tax=Rotaria sordida TaxID=392033 RepID=A0A815S1Q9_9BILA|nr:unnamed protein product [Rotaria sordida]
MILDELEENENPTSETITRGLKRKKVEISSRTVQRRLKEAGYQFSASLSKPLLTTIHKKRHLKWALSMQNQNWDQIVFSDESTIRLGPVKRRQWQLKGFRKVFRTIKYPGKVNVWDCFAPRGFGQILCFSPNLTSKFLCKQIYTKALRH